MKLDEINITRALRSLPQRMPPPGFTTRLRVLASRELQTSNQTTWDRWVNWFSHVRWMAESMARPLALPFAGGLFSAVALFTTFVVPTYPVRASDSYDVPTMLTTEAFIKSTGPLGSAYSDLVVDVTIDEQGRMVDYIIVSGAAILTDAARRRRLENTLLFTEFVPATAFGVPTAGRVRLSLNSSQIEVKG
jgi:hypothetical protein